MEGVQVAAHTGDFSCCEGTSVGPADAPIPCRGTVALQASVSPEVNPAAWGTMDLVNIKECEVA